MNKILIALIFGFVVGMVFFYIFEDAHVSNSFMDGCWVRQQPRWLVHNKVYILGLFIIFEGWRYQDILLMVLGGGWIGLHLAQDIAERIHEAKFGREKMVMLSNV